MKKKILVVDDEPDIITIIEKMLRDKFQIISASNGFECIKIAKQEKPDLILLDILMPKLDGWETLSELKKIEQLKNIPVSMLTALPLTPEDTKNKPINKIENYIVKPFRKETLLSKIDDIFETENEAQSSYQEIYDMLGDSLAKEYLTLIKSINRHRRLIGVILSSSPDELKQTVKNLILSQKRLIETMKTRAGEIISLLEDKRHN